MAPQTVHPKLKAHADRMRQRIFSFKGYVHTAYAFAPSNATMIEGEDGVVLVDTLPSLEFAEPVAAAFRDITTKPIKAVIYTHVHPDHISGVKAFVSEDDVRRGDVEIIALEDLVPALVRDGGMLAPVLGRRAMYTYGFQLPLGDAGNVSTGLGPPNKPGRRSFIAPTCTFTDKAELEICGIRLELHHVPSETDDQVVVWLPDDRILISADVVQGNTFPNVYALRGTSFRNPMVWVDGIDRLRRMTPEILIPHHGFPVEGAEAVENLLCAYRDAMQYLHDQTVRLINHGRTPDEIIERVTMPQHLADHAWLGEFYGAYKHCIPAIYGGYLGWFEGDPVALDPPPRAERARRYVALMGGRDRLLAAARDAFDAGDDQWAAELATWIIRADLDDDAARTLKADALRRWGYAQININWRNWALTAALELEGALTPPRGLAFGGEDTLMNFPAAALLRLMCVRLDGEAALETRCTVAFRTTDTGEGCALEVRNGVCQFHPEPPDRADVTLRFERRFLTAVYLGRTGFLDGIADGAVAIAGEIGALRGFLDLFEPPPSDLPIAVR